MVQFIYINELQEGYIIWKELSAKLLCYQNVMNGSKENTTDKALPQSFYPFTPQKWSFLVFQNKVKYVPTVFIYDLSVLPQSLKINFRNNQMVSRY